MRNPIHALLPLATLLTLSACGLDPAKVAAHTLLADDGATVETEDGVQFARDAHRWLGSPRLRGADGRPGERLDDKGLEELQQDL